MNLEMKMMLYVFVFLGEFFFLLLLRSEGTEVTER